MQFVFDGGPGAVSRLTVLRTVTPERLHRKKKQAADLNDAHPISPRSQASSAASRQSSNVLRVHFHRFSSRTENQFAQRNRHRSIHLENRSVF